MPRLITALIFVLSFVAGGPILAQAHGRENPVPTAPYLGLLPSTAPGSAGNWSVEMAFPNLTFNDPLQMLELPGPGGDKWLMIGKSGFAWVFDDDPATTTKTEVLDIEQQVYAQPDGGLLGVVLHPDFDVPGAIYRRTLYLFYRYTPDSNYSGRKGYMRLSRFTMNEAMDQIDPLSEFVMIQQYDRHDWHNGGGMFFGPDGFLYLTIGDEGAANDSYNQTQELDEGLFSGLLRIDVNQDPTKSHPIRRQPINVEAPPSGWPGTFTQGYFIPNDNPWVDPSGNTLEEFWAIGLRSPHRVSYDPVENQIWVGDIGQGSREEVSIIPRAGNLQWPYKEGSINGPKPMPSPLIGTDQPPIYDYPRSVGHCVIGGFVYRGNLFHAELGGRYIFGDHYSRNVWALTPDPLGGPPDLEFMVNIPSGGTGSKNGISSFGTDSDGNVYVLKLFGTDLDGGFIYKLVQNNAVPDPPMWLSQLGLFQDLSTLDPLPELLPYTVNSRLWSDRAAKDRWVAVPNDGTHDTNDEKARIRTYGDWEFPAGTVFVKHFDLPLDANDPSQTRRLETRVLVVDENQESYGLTYRWESDESDARLLTQSETGVYTVLKADGSSEQQTWTFPSRVDCSTCHNGNAGWVRGPSTHQLNGERTYPDSGETDNQLRTWNHLGLLRPAVREADIAALPRTIPIDHPTYDRAYRMRSYLDSNCAQCHRPGGTGANFDARFVVPLALQNLVDGPVNGSYGSPDARVIAPGDPAHSIMLQRMSSPGADRMPPLATSVVDEAATGVLADWIDALAPADPLCDNIELAIPQSEISILFADSEESGTPATFALDGNPDTHWHTEYQGSDPPHPHELQLDLGASYDLSGLTHLPRQTTSSNGSVDQFTVYVSNDPGNWGPAVASGSFPADKLESRFAFNATGRYVRFVADSEINSNPWTSLAELNVLKAPCLSGCAAPPIVNDLILAELTAGTELSWTTGGGFGVQFDVVRSGDPSNFAAPSCVAVRNGTGLADDPEVPQAGQTYYYLTRGVDACTGLARPAGQSSDGQERVAGLCPLPE